MTDQHDGPGVSLQGHGQGMTHLQIQVIGGLVQNQQIGVLPNHHGQGQSCFFPAGEGRDRLPGPISPEIEAAQEIQYCLFPGRGVESLQV